ncbi:hypothetical protein BDK51DRAFT_36580 [Blyttiomyces helicus]|uniref:Uncharacterized protein n=1 Tax=Blyttiomyces helicus TaxID=388810 RepID=A0A4V1ISN2_9FUNG|nr:hypothetical protein BDK51DRAFT_36580 [Blyttiomyces helicus]|eukprot:RKO94147.1 hypothetical protein BDK51DRAFT_36580 [Blyttiomyces helicus]
MATANGLNHQIIVDPLVVHTRINGTFDASSLTPGLPLAQHLQDVYTVWRTDAEPPSVKFFHIGEIFELSTKPKLLIWEPHHITLKPAKYHLLPAIIATTQTNTFLEAWRVSNVYYVVQCIPVTGRHDTRILKIQATLVIASKELMDQIANKPEMDETIKRHEGFLKYVIQKYNATTSTQLNNEVAANDLRALPHEREGPPRAQVTNSCTFGEGLD